MATKQVKIRRGTDTQHGSFTGVVGEITVDTTNYSLRIHDAFTTGGHELARADGSNIDNFSVGGNLTVTGDLTVSGTTTTVNSTTVTIDDPIFTLGGDTAPASDDNKDRGIEFQWHDGTSAKLGFFGFDDSTSKFTFIPDATNTSEVFSGTVGDVVFGDIEGTLTTASQTNITGLGTITVGTWNGTSIADAYVDNNLTISGGTVDNSAIGGSTPSTGVFTTLTANTSLTASGLSYPSSDGTNGQVLTTDGAGNLTFSDASGGASTLDELTDTNITTPADGSLLFYDTGTSKWIDNVVSGDITIADTGVASIGTGVIINADINASAAIDISKTALVAGTGLTLTGNTLDVDASQTGITSVGTLSSLTVTGDLTVDTNTLYVDSTNNRIGIGTSLPSGKLDVELGATGIIAEFRGADSDILQINSESDLIALDIRNTTNGLDFQMQGNSKMRLTTAGNFGIGCTPTYKLDVEHDQDASTPTMSIVNKNTGTSSAARLFFDADGNNFSIYSWGDATSKANATEFNSNAGSSYFIFSPSNTEKVRMTSTGVGIGTAPDSLLHISSGNSGDAVVIIEADEDNNDEGDLPLLLFRADGGINEGSIGLHDNEFRIISNVNSAGGISFWTGTTNNYGLENTTGATQRMIITDAGLAVDNVVKVTSVESGNPTPSTDNIHLSGYGIIGNRSTVYVTNASGGAVQIGNGSVHNSNAIATFDSGGLSLDGDIAITQSSDTSVGLTIDRNSATGRAQMVLATESGGELWRFGITGGGGEDFAFFDGGANVLVLDRSSNTATFAGPIITTGLTSSGPIIIDGNRITLDNVASRDKYRVWDSTLYTIGMDYLYSYGGLNDYAMTFQMNNQNNRGFWFGDDQHTNAQGAMSLTTQGNMTLASSLRVGFGESDTSSATDGNTLQVLGNQVFGSAGVGSSTSGAWLSFEGNADAGGEGSGRLFFREHNSTTTDMDDYGVSFGYRGGGTSVTTAGGNTWTGLSAIGNGEWGMWGHDNSLAGALIMSGSRNGSSVKFTDGCDLQMWNSSNNSSTRIDMPRSGFITFYGDNSTNHAIGSRGETGIATDDLRINSYGSVIINLDSNNNNSSDADLIIGRHGGGTGTVDELWRFSGEDNSLTTESDYFMFSTTDTTLYNNGAAGNEGVLFATGDSIQIARVSNGCLYANRMSTDGGVIYIYQNGTQEGYINVSGTTVSLVGFTGSHWSRLPDNTKPDIPKGTILESLDEMVEWYMVEFTHTWITHKDDEEITNTSFKREPYVLQEGESVGDVVDFEFEGTTYQATIVKEQNDKHVQCKISDTVDSKTVYGVFEQWDEDDDMVNDMLVATTGSFIIRMHANETVQKGDLIQSNGDGTGKVQADDLVRASTVAKILSNTVCETYDDGSYTVPCSLLVG